MSKEEKLKPRVLESTDRLRKLVELDAPSVIIGAAAWSLFQTVLAAYGAAAGSTMISSIRDKNLHLRGVCSQGDCTAYVERPSVGMCADCLKSLGLPADAEEIPV